MSNIKKAFLPLHEALTGLAGNTTIASVLQNPEILKLMEAGKGGFTGEDSFVTIDGAKVGRICAMTGAVFAHNNDNKEQSFFYKNGSYMIGAEILKANARKVWEDDRTARLQELEDDMMDARLTPKEWKAEASAVQAEEFKFTLTDERKAELVEAFNGYADKDAFTEAYTNEDVAPFTDYEAEVEKLRAEYVKPLVDTEEETTEEA